MKRFLPPTLAAVVAVPLSAVALPALAAPAPSTAAAPAATAPALTSYQQQTTPVVDLPSGAQIRLDVTCPARTKVVGGGAMTAPNVDLSVNTSAPVFDGRRWRVAVSNSSNADASFQAYAVCVTGVQKYSIVEGIGVDNPGSTQDTASAFCPDGTVPLGGGGQPIEAVTTVSLNSSLPLLDGWQVRVNNTGTDDDFILPYAVCARQPAGYRQVAGPTLPLAPLSAGQAAARCPSGTNVLGGGGRSLSQAISVSLSASAPTSARSWRITESNNNEDGTRLRAYATCAQVTS